MKWFLCIYSHDHLVFVLFYINIAFYTLQVFQLYQPWILGINPTLSWYISPFTCCCVWCVKDVCIYIHNYENRFVALFPCDICLFLVAGSFWLHKMSWGVFLLLLFFGVIFMCSDHNGIKLEINNREKFQKFTYS